MLTERQAWLECAAETRRRAMRGNIYFGLCDLTHWLWKNNRISRKLTDRMKRKIDRALGRLRKQTGEKWNYCLWSRDLAGHEKRATWAEERAYHLRTKR